MKELKVYVPQDWPYGLEPEEGGEPVEEETCYLKSDVDAEIAELKQKLESVQATAYAESVDAGMKNRRLKRSLWIARAERAKEVHFMLCQLIYDKKYGIVKFNVRKEWYKNIKQGQMLHTPQGWADVWDIVERKCRAKAEEYK